MKPTLTTAHEATEQAMSGAAHHTPADVRESLGQWFHGRLESERQRLGLPQPAHPEDEAHNRAVGAALLLTFTGRVAEGLALYNAWASAHAYESAAILSWSPLVVDIGDGTLNFHRWTFDAVVPTASGGDSIANGA